MRIALAQVNPTVGDFEGNKKLILTYINDARRNGADIIAFPELAITGYPAEDLIYKKSFVDANLNVLEDIARNARGITVIVGFIDRDDFLYNAAAVIHNKKVVAKYHKIHLPNYGVFDEERYFRPGRVPLVLDMGHSVTGINICEDIWTPEGPSRIQAIAGDAHLIINISASPFHIGKSAEREKMLATRARDYLTWIAYVNMVGGQDELIFDGRSVVCNESGKLVARGRAFEEDMVIVDIDVSSIISCRARNATLKKHKDSLKDVIIERVKVQGERGPAKKNNIIPAVKPELRPEEEVYSALILGIRDYVKKNNFKKVLIGISGGVDSALTACLAVDALGRGAVVGVSMPSMYSSPDTKRDARKLAKNLGIAFDESPITGIYKEFLKTLSGIFRNTESGVAEENIQARIRGTLLMAISNKFGYLVLTTGNKSEVSTGYCTLYGDTAGGFAPLKDVPKTMVYKLAEYRNTLGKKEIIPSSIIMRKPSAELKPNQTDQDTLPRYEILDKIIEAYVENDMSFDDMLKLGIPLADLRKSIELIFKSEYKRRQSPPGIKITPRAFGKDRRLPITNKFLEIK